MLNITAIRRKNRSAAELNIAPLIDMVFILLIFFLVNTSFVKETGIDVNRPTAATAITKNNATILTRTQEPISTSETKTHYFNSFTRSNWRVWAWSALVATGMNLLLFLVMPHLMDPSPERGTVDTLIPQVNVVRVKRPDSTVQRKTSPPKPEKKKIPKPKEVLKQPIQTKLSLPFELNPRLPSGPQTLAVPDWTSAPMQAGLAVTPFSAEQLDAPLTTLVRIPPVFPMRARRRDIQGWVKVAFVVDESGHVGDITILEAQPEGLFEDSVRRCVGGWRFKPGTVEGMPVKAKVEAVIRFELE